MKTMTFKRNRFMLSFSALILGSAIGASAFAADPAYSAAKDQADANYKAAKARCDTLSGNDKDVCIKQAKATKEGAKADANVAHETKEATKDAREDKLTAQYKVAKEKCDVLSGSEKDACQERAKATYGQ